MRVNADFTKRASVHAGALGWVQSPMPGVERRMLDRIGDEVARATSIVRYAPGTAFSPHTHPGGEEFFVLDGTFQDERGDYPAGSYVRNPPTSRHTPRSQAGCTIFVKLFQFDPEDRSHVTIDTRLVDVAAPAGRPDVTLIPLFSDGREDVRLEQWRADASIVLDVPGGFEALVLDGGFEEGGETFVQHSWLRLPKGSRLAALASAAGARLWIKTGHLQHVVAHA
jgi:quercetin dioxygenase-like cupin family protein